MFPKKPSEDNKSFSLLQFSESIGGIGFFFQKEDTHIVKPTKNIPMNNLKGYKPQNINIW